MSKVKLKFNVTQKTFPKLVKNLKIIPKTIRNNIWNII